jgi:hypothetical protein
VTGSAGQETRANQIREALDALSAVGSAWRGDWSNFDGRTLRDQIDGWRRLMERAMAGECESGEADAWLNVQGICPLCGWREYCFAPDDHSLALRARLGAGR